MVRLLDRITAMSRSRRLRRLVPDEALFDRRAAGEPLRELASDYGVAHTTLLRFFNRSEAKLELEEADRRLQAEREGRRAMEQGLQKQARTRARKEAEHDRLLEAWTPPAQPRRSAFEISLDERDARVRLGSRDVYSANDDVAAKVVAAGGGVEQIIDATPLRGQKNILHNIDRQILERAFDNDAKSPANARPDDNGLRRLAPTSELIRRRASRETLRSLAVDFGVSHTTLSRYFKRKVVAKQVDAEQQAQRRHHRPARNGDHS
jgi:AraC-like DNA-binding protein